MYVDKIKQMHFVDEQQQRTDLETQYVRPALTGFQLTFYYKAVSPPTLVVLNFEVLWKLEENGGCFKLP